MASIIDKILRKKEKKKKGNIFIAGTNVDNLLDLVIKYFKIPSKKLYTEQTVLFDNLKELEKEAIRRENEIVDKGYKDYTQLFEPKFVVIEDLESLDLTNTIMMKAIKEKLVTLTNKSEITGLFFIFIVKNDNCANIFLDIYKSCLYKIHFGEFKDSIYIQEIFEMMTRYFTNDELNDTINKLVIQYSDVDVALLNIEEFNFYMRQSV